jgi:hypothetical protein
MTNAETQASLTRFYEAFARRDGEAMAALYAKDATFEDPVFRLTGSDIGKMWIPRWAAQALGLPGRLFGRTDWLRRSVSKSAAARLGVPPKP